MDRMLSRLSAKLGALERDYKSLTKSQKETLLNVIYSFLEQLWDKVEREKTASTSQIHELRNIEERMERLRLRFQAEPENYWRFWDAFVRPWNFLAKIINFVATFVGVGPLVPTLPAAPETKLLSYDDYVDYGED
jgi:hypothetical protein